MAFKTDSDTSTVTTAVDPVETSVITSVEPAETSVAVTVETKEPQRLKPIITPPNEVYSGGVIAPDFGGNN